MDKDSENFEDSLQLKALVLLCDAELEEDLGIDDKNVDHYYEHILKDWADPAFLDTKTEEEIEKYLEHVIVSLWLLDEAKEKNIDISEERCLDERYREQWITLEQIFKNKLNCM